MFVAGWRHALRSEWPSIIIIIINAKTGQQVYNAKAVLTLKSQRRMGEYEVIHVYPDEARRAKRKGPYIVVPCANMAVY